MRSQQVHDRKAHGAPNGLRLSKCPIVKTNTRFEGQRGGGVQTCVLSTQMSCSHMREAFACVRRNCMHMLVCVHV